MSIYNEVKEITNMLKLSYELSKGSEKYLSAKSKKALTMLNTIGAISGATLLSDIALGRGLKKTLINQMIMSTASVGVVIWHPGLFKDQYNAGYESARSKMENK